jgi:hypothetical protein|tara:strand:- start:801 stop:980 length:180 start_codon:yes stop_codon:yes gene_type:complete
MGKWLDRERKKLKKTVARKIDSSYTERGQGKDSAQKKKDDQFRKSLSEWGDELMEMLNN